MRAWLRSNRRASIVAIVVGLCVLNAVLRPQVEALEDDAARDELLDEAKAKGLTDEQATCVVDGMEDQFGPDLDSATIADADVRVMLTTTFECLGADLGVDDCVVDAVIEVMDLSERPEALDLVEAEASLDAGDREQIAEAGLSCQGASAGVAACVTDAMREEFGEDVFDSRVGPGLTTEGQERIQALIGECSVGERPGPPDPGGVPLDCEAYTRSISAAWSAVAPPDFAPAATARAAADALARSARDAPREIAEDVAAIVEAAQENAAQVEETFGDSTSDEAVFAAFELASLEPDAQIRVWVACPNLDDGLEKGGVTLAQMVFAIGGSQADMEEELHDCLQSPRIAEPGDSEGCDRLVDACESGTYEACDDIFLWSDVGSTYEEIGSSCGGRLESGDDLYGRGTCEVLNAAGGTELSSSDQP